MELFSSIESIKLFLSEKRLEGSIAFVPTMGALHQGHLSLVKRAAEHAPCVVVSIFINPIQFNNKEDYENYPILLENDLKMLNSVGCSAVFVPSVKEMYPNPPSEIFKFGKLETVMEGAFRPGHFNGVAIVVSRLFDIIQPDFACFGKKDYQQLAVIKELVRKRKSSLTLIPVEIMREPDGLAMSSRNLRLSPEERLLAPRIYQALLKAKELMKSISVSETEKLVLEEINKTKEFVPEYICIADANTLQPLKDWQDGKPVIFAAVYLGAVRLIDNVELF